MGREQPGSGDAGEGLGGNYLNYSFTNRGVSKIQPGSAVDFACWGLRAARSATLLSPHSTVVFHFQIKSSMTSFNVNRNTFDEWLALTETQPVILMAVDRKAPNKQEWSFMCLHSWLLTDRGREALTNSRRIPFTPTRDFTPVDERDSNFHKLLISEANRAEASQTSVWWTLRDYGLLPFDESLFLKYLELASFAEIPRELALQLQELGKVPSVTRGLITGELECDNQLKNWIETIRKRAGPLAATGFQRRQFGHFVKAMNNWHDKNDLAILPAFRAPEVGAWRAFSVMYPQSLEMYKAVILKSNNPGHIMFASAMLPLLALTTDRAVSAKAWDIIRLLKNRFKDFSDYGFQRELLRSPAEAGEPTALASVVDLVTRKESRRLELNFLDRYGWKQDLLESNLVRKLNQPLLRDEYLQRLYEGMHNSLLVRKHNSK